ncbi:PLP-dependent aminotransferase family protein [Chitinophaga sp. CF418]|uniref:aminotransferase-like domain-containing protein n=1 Tax=Chitinophaga sp. CF418 TaxID=1855287 RepID=UPI0009236443|nr:PLP-dependent aminotransferase family protein [Chitinophaga sp. CF418]SHL89290.1 GntR family transcriptional regulator / MocR family aminotransferase [Chitinophaga sp. CF418]
MLPYKNLIVINKKSSVAVYRQLALQFINLIQEGKLLPGTELPSTRTLANDLQLHRKTIMAAYNALVTEDWVDNLPRKGYAVSPRLPVVRPRSYNTNRLGAYKGISGFMFEKLETVFYPSVSLAKSRIVVNDGFPDISLLPTEAIIKEYRSVLEHATLNRIGTEWNAEGSTDFRKSLCSFLNQTRGMDIGMENLLTSRGAQMAIYVAASLIIQPGDKVVVCDPSYLLASMLFEQLGAELIRVPIDEQGMCTEPLEEILKNNDVRLLYVIPHHHHPTTVTLSAQRRNHLLQLIKAHDLAVIEDDYDYDFQFQYDPYLPLASGDHGGNIIYIGSLTKVLGTPFRLGYMIATQEFIQSAAKLRALIDLRGEVLMEQTVAGLIDNGELARHIKKANRLYAERCNFLSDLINNELSDVVDFTKPTGGMALWLKFRHAYPLSKIIKKAGTMGLAFTGSVYNEEINGGLNACRFGFASLQDEEMKEAVSILRKAADTI